MLDYWVWCIFLPLWRQLNFIILSHERYLSTHLDRLDQTLHCRPANNGCERCLRVVCRKLPWHWSLQIAWIDLWELLKLNARGLFFIRNVFFSPKVRMRGWRIRSKWAPTALWTISVLVCDINCDGQFVAIISSITAFFSAFISFNSLTVWKAHSLTSKLIWRGCGKVAESEWHILLPCVKLSDYLARPVTRICVDHLKSILVDIEVETLSQLIVVFLFLCSLLVRLNRCLNLQWCQTLTKTVCTTETLCFATLAPLSHSLTAICISD